MVKLELVFPENKLSRAIASITQTEIELKGGIPEDFSQEKIQDVKIIITFDENGYYEFPLKVEKSENILVFSMDNSSDTYKNYQALVGLYSQKKLNPKSIQKIRTYFVEIEKTPFLKPSSKKSLLIIGGISLLCGFVWWQWLLTFSSNRALVVAETSFVRLPDCALELYNSKTMLLAEGTDIGTCMRTVDVTLAVELDVLLKMQENLLEQKNVFSLQNQGERASLLKEKESLEALHRKAREQMQNAFDTYQAFSRSSAVAPLEVEKLESGYKQATENFASITSQKEGADARFRLLDEKGVSLNQKNLDKNPNYLYEQVTARIEKIQKISPLKVIMPFDGYFYKEISFDEAKSILRFVQSDMRGKPKTLVVFPAQLGKVAELMGKSFEFQGKQFTVVKTAANYQQYYGIPPVFVMSGEILIVAESQESIDISMVGFMDKIRIRWKSFKRLREIWPFFCEKFDFSQKKLLLRDIILFSIFTWKFGFYTNIRKQPALRNIFIVLRECFKKLRNKILK